MPAVNPLGLAVRDNVPDGCVVSLAGIPDYTCFAQYFREELQARGLGLPVSEVNKRPRR